MSNGSEGSNNLSGGGGEGLSLPGSGAVAAAPLSRCDEGTEIKVAIVPLQMGEAVKLKVVLCGAAFRVRVFLNDNVIFDQSGLANQVDVLLPPLSPGFHSLVWSYLPSSSPWKTRSEVSVNDMIRFCLKKGSDSSVASNNLMVLLQVI